MDFLYDSYLVVAISFALFVLLLIYLGVPGMIARMLDARADKIRAELDEAKALREEARAILDSYEVKRKDVENQAASIVAAARDEAQNAAVEARAELEATIERRIQAAKDRIASAEASALREIKDKAATVAVAAARDVIARNMTAADGTALIDAAIADVGDRLH